MNLIIIILIKQIANILLKIYKIIKIQVKWMKIMAINNVNKNKLKSKNTVNFKFALQIKTLSQSIFNLISILIIKFNIIIN